MPTGPQLPRVSPSFLHRKVGLNPEVKAKLKVKSLLTSGLRCAAGRRGCPGPAAPTEPPRPRGELGPRGGFCREKLPRYPGLRLEWDPRTERLAADFPGSFCHFISPFLKKKKKKSKREKKRSGIHRQKLPTSPACTDTPIKEGTEPPMFGNRILSPFPRTPRAGR